MTWNWKASDIMTGPTVTIMQGDVLDKLREIKERTNSNVLALDQFSAPAGVTDSPEGRQ
jgi:hypothetical protein